MTDMGEEKKGFLADCGKDSPRREIISYMELTLFSAVSPRLMMTSMKNWKKS